jgi:hypothetical protein
VIFLNLHPSPLVLFSMNLTFQVLDVPLCLHTFKVIAANLVLVVKLLSNRRTVLGAKLMVLLQTSIGKVLTRTQELMTVQDDFINFLNY